MLVQVVNRSGEPATLAPMSEVAAVALQPEILSGKRQEASVTGEELWETYKDQTGELTQAEKERLKAWLENNRDLFAVNSKAPPATPVLQIHLDTGNSRPVACPPRRYSVEEQAIIDEEVGQWEKNGVYTGGRGD